MCKAKLSYGFPVKTVCYKIDYKYHDEHDNIYEAMMRATDGDVEISIDAASWCESASVGECYEFREGIIEIIEED